MIELLIFCFEPFLYTPNPESNIFSALLPHLSSIVSLFAVVVLGILNLRLLNQHKKIDIKSVIYHKRFDAALESYKLCATLTWELSDFVFDSTEKLKKDDIKEYDLIQKEIEQKYFLLYYKLRDMQHQNSGNYILAPQIIGSLFNDFIIKAMQIFQPVTIESDHNHIRKELYGSLKEIAKAFYKEYKMKSNDKPISKMT